MRTNIVFTLTGPDRVGIVEDVTAVMLGLDGNVETSRMTRLGGEFAILMLVSLPEARADEVESAIARLAAEGYRVSVSTTDRATAEAYRGWLRYQIDVHGADHEGIIHEMARGLSRRGINIESADTGTTRAPVSGTPLFSMMALVAVPPDLAEAEWTEELREVVYEANVGISITAVDVE
ncbi:MAG: glycine cleavage system protein R [Anaerosomatales bacterium]|nr:transcriptional regulator [Coriobacteriia bacterium]